MPIGIPLESRMSTSMRPVVPEDQVLMIMLMIVSMLVFMLVSVGTVCAL